tara:strand:+ start:1429 stop:2067 length:639 start_codon:yes stop_codon:yes gene_type:complete
MADKNNDKNKSKKSSKKPDLKLVKTPICSESETSDKKIRTYKKNSQRPNARQYDRESVAEFVCSELALGKSLRSILDADDKLPSVRSFLDWVVADSFLATQYARARTAQYELLADEIVAIADENYTTDEHGVKERLSSEAIQRNRLRVDTRKWMLSKMLPKVYGDHTKVTNEHTGKDGGPIQLAAVDLRNLSDSELDDMQRLLDKVGGDESS